MNSNIVRLLPLPLLFFSSAGRSAQVGNSENTKPNIIYILADDLGFGDLSCYGQPVLLTPNIDKLAAEGIRFTRHYAGSTVCSPSRASWLTGKHTGHTSVRGNFPDQMVGDHENTIAKILKKSGYTTGIIGKWGVGHPLPTDDPAKKGFDFSYGYINMYHAHNHYPEFLYRDGVKEKIQGNKLARNSDGTNPWSKMPEGTGVSSERNSYATDLFEKEAIQFIQQNKDIPFFLFLSLNIPHANNENVRNGMETPTYYEFGSKEWPEPEKGMAAMIRKLDETVGSIMKTLHEAGIDKNSIVLFCSDNGPHSEGRHSSGFFKSSGVFKGQKRDLYQGGIRVPFIVRWPGNVQSGSVTDHISAFWDVLPTFCEIAGVPIPTDTDGISFLPTLLCNRAEQKNHPYLYWEFHEGKGKQAVMADDCTLIKNNAKETPVYELYNIGSDISETKNLLEQYPEITSRLKSYIKQAHTPFPVSPELDH